MNLIFVTLSYDCDGTKNVLYFHTGPQGVKIAFMKKNPNVSATIIDDRGYLKNECGHEYRSIVIFGRMTLLNELEEKKHGMEVLLNCLEENPNSIKVRTL